MKDSFDDPVLPGQPAVYVPNPYRQAIEAESARAVPVCQDLESVLRDAIVHLSGSWEGGRADQALQELDSLYAAARLAANEVPPVFRDAIILQPVTVLPTAWQVRWRNF